MTYKTQKNYTAIFVDCFSTIIYRNIRRKEVFKQWAIELSEKYNIPWKIIYKKYNQTNFNLSFKKLFTTITLQEHFDTVLKNLFNKLAKKYNNLELIDFIKTATTTYYNKELACFTVNQKLIDFLLSEKNAGKKEKNACIGNNIGIVNTFVWASRYSNFKNYYKCVIIDFVMDP